MGSSVQRRTVLQGPQVIAALKRGGVIVSVSTAGSRQIAGADLSKQDFAFFPRVSGGREIRRDHATSKAFVPFYTPMAIATWKPIVDLLTTAGVVHTTGDVTKLDVSAYMKLVDKNTRWKDLPGNTTYPVNKSILITSTDVRKSNSAAMYLSLTSYVANSDNIVEKRRRGCAAHGSARAAVSPPGLRREQLRRALDDYLVQGSARVRW